MGVIVVLMHMNVDELGLPEGSPVLRGEFKKFSGDWYEKVGRTITMTMILQIVAPHGAALMPPVVAFVRRCWDR
jgi:hypothetical protein